MAVRSPIALGALFLAQRQRIRFATYFAGTVEGNDFDEEGAAIVTDGKATPGCLVSFRATSIDPNRQLSAEPIVWEVITRFCFLLSFLPPLLRELHVLIARPDAKLVILSFGNIAQRHCKLE